MKKWEYRIARLSETSDLEQLRVLGLEGWELVTVVQGQAGITAYLKREEKGK